MANSYKNITRPDSQAAKGGYKDVFLLGMIPEMTTVARPAAPGAGDPIGKDLEITTAHAFTSPAGFVSWLTKTNSVTGKATSVGDEGEQLLEWEYKFTVLGDSSSNQRQMQNLLNDAESIALFKDSNCLDDDSYIQLGDECNTPVYSVEFDSKDKKTGMKQYIVTAKCSARYFYKASVVMAA